MSTPNNSVDSFDASKLTSAGSSAPKASAPKSERVIMEVEQYLTPADNFHYAVGRRIDSPDEVIKVRLNSVAERHQDKPKLTVEEITKTYQTSDTPRETIADKEKANIRFISFDDAKAIGKDENGVTEFRAHWPKTMSADPKSEVMHGLAHIKLSEGAEGKKSQAYVELIQSKVTVNKDNVDAVMADALSTTDSAGRGRDPIMMVRIAHEGKVVASPRVYPAVETIQVFDQNAGGMVDRNKSVTADKTIAALMSAAPGKSDLETVSADRVRAVIAGIKGLDEPTFNAADEGMRDNARNMYHGAKAGHLQIEIISAEKIDFGADSRVTYVKDKEKPHLAAYTIKEPANADGTKQKETPGFAETVIAINRHQDGEPYAVFASPVAMYPKMQKLVDLPLSQPEVSNVNDAQKSAKKEEAAGLDI